MAGGKGQVSKTGEAALRYAGMGFAVYAPAYHSKVPNKGMSGVEGRASDTATKDPDVLKAIYNEKPKNNVATRLDMCEPPIVCIDEDDAEAHPKQFEVEAGVVGEHGSVVFSRWCDENGVEMPPTLTIISPTGGRGRLYRLPKGEQMPNKKPDVLLRVDMLGAGQGQVLPPSSTKAGMYRWEDGLSPDDMGLSDVPELPMAVLKLWRDSLESKRDEKNANARKKRRKNKRMDEFESLTGHDIEKGYRDETMFKAAYALHAAGMSYDDILAKLLEVNAERCKPPLPESVIEEKVKSATSYPVNAVGSSFMINGGILYRFAPNGGLEFVTDTPPHVEAAIEDVGTNERRLLVSFARPGRQAKTVVMPPNELVTTHGIVDRLYSVGANITSANAMAVIAWLTECEARRKGDLPVTPSYDRMGWTKGNDISPCMPYDRDGSEIAFYPQPDAEMFCAPYEKPMGDLAEWVDVIGAARSKSVPFRAALDASFASPLLGPLHVQPFVFSIWGGSGSGKTATAKACQSVYADPSMMLTANGSPTAFSKLATFLGSFPLVLNELQAREAQGGQKGRRESFQVIAYQLAEGMDKLTLQKTRKFNSVGKWSLVPIVTGEVPTLDATSQQGQRNRTIELACEPFEDQAEAGRLHVFVADHYGMAGRAFIKALQNVGGDALRKIWGDFRAKFGEHLGYGHLANNCTLLAFADALSEYYVFSPGKKWEECCSAGLDLAIEIIRRVEGDGGRDAQRDGIEIMASWMEANRSLFAVVDDERPIIGCLGRWYADHAVINGAEFTKAMNAAGLDAPGLRRTLKKLGITQCDEGRTTKSERLVRGGAPVPCVHVLLDRLEDYLDRR